MDLAFLDTPHAIIREVVFRIQHLSFSIMFSRFIYAVTYVSIPFFFIADAYSIVWECHISFLCSPADGRLGRFQFLTIANNAAVSIHLQVFLLGGYLAK